MKVNRIVKHSAVDGEGVRTVIFFQGCHHKCDECFSPDTWNMSLGKEYTPKDLFLEISEIMENPPGFCQGITLSGGEPFLQSNEIIRFLKIFKSYYPDKDIWSWTGYTMNTLPDTSMLNHIDVLIDGKFKIDNTPSIKHWRGSNNQNMYKKVNDVWQKID